MVNDLADILDLANLRLEERMDSNGSRGLEGLREELRAERANHLFVREEDIAIAVLLRRIPTLAEQLEGTWGRDLALVLEFLEGIAENAAPNLRLGLNPILVGKAAEVHAETIRAMLAAAQPESRS